MYHKFKNSEKKKKLNFKMVNIQNKQRNARKLLLLLYLKETRKNIVRKAQRDKKREIDIKHGNIE